MSMTRFTPALVAALALVPGLAAQTEAEQAAEHAVKAAQQAVEQARAALEKAARSLGGKPGESFDDVVKRYVHKHVEAGLEGEHAEHLQRAKVELERAATAKDKDKVKWQVLHERLQDAAKKYMVKTWPEVDVHVETLTPEVKTYVKALHDHAARLEPEIQAHLEAIRPQIEAHIAALRPKIEAHVEGMEPKIRAHIEALTPQIEAHVEQMVPRLEAHLKALHEREAPETTPEALPRRPAKSTPKGAAEPRRRPPVEAEAEDLRQEIEELQREAQELQRRLRALQAKTRGRSD
jgi:hypothetical protein